MALLCRACLHWSEEPQGLRCPACGSVRTVSHPELGALTLAHLDCDAFYAAVEKRDDPSLGDRPVIVGGGSRGVVTTCCYIARIHGVRSAMPMFKARRLCPDAVVIPPRMAAYAEVSRQIRALMDPLTPLIEPLSLDEAFLDLAGTQRLLGAPAALTMARLAARIEREIGISVSIGLSHCKFLAKLASDLDKPRGFTVVGRGETPAFLDRQPVGRIWGVGAALADRLVADGFTRIGDLRRSTPQDLVTRYGRIGLRLHDLAHGIDRRRVEPNRPVRSISAETTFETDLAELDPLRGHLWRLAVRVADRAKAKGLAGGTVTLKLKTAGFRTLTRQTALPEPTQLAEGFHPAAALLLTQAQAQGPFRLIGIGLSQLGPAPAEDVSGLFADAAQTRARAERATDQIRARFGAETIFRGRSLR